MVLTLRVFPLFYLLYIYVAGSSLCFPVLALWFCSISYGKYFDFSIFFSLYVDKFSFSLFIFLFNIFMFQLFVSMLFAVLASHHLVLPD